MMWVNAGYFLFSFYDDAFVLRNMRIWEFYISQGNLNVRHYAWLAWIIVFMYEKEICEFLSKTIFLARKRCRITLTPRPIKRYHTRLFEVKIQLIRSYVTIRCFTWILLLSSPSITYRFYSAWKNPALQYMLIFHKQSIYCLVKFKHT